MADLLVAVTTAVIHHDGRPYRIRKGDTVVYADDPVVKGREQLFRPLQVRYLGKKPQARAKESRKVEEATAVPGDKRALAEPQIEDRKPVMAEVRAWARDNDFDVPSRGRVPDEVMDAYRQAHGGTG